MSVGRGVENIQGWLNKRKGEEKLGVSRKNKEEELGRVRRSWEELEGVGKS